MKGCQPSHILDHLSRHESPDAARISRGAGAGFLLLPPSGPSASKSSGASQSALALRQLSIASCSAVDPMCIHSKAALAKPYGVCPIPVSSGKTNRMRLNRGGNRHANEAI